jgi:hypothetical protein
LDVIISLSFLSWDEAIDLGKPGGLLFENPILYPQHAALSACRCAVNKPGSHESARSRSGGIQYSVNAGIAASLGMTIQFIGYPFYLEEKAFGLFSFLWREKAEPEFNLL